MHRTRIMKNAGCQNLMIIIGSSTSIVRMYSGFFDFCSLSSAVTLNTTASRKTNGVASNHSSASPFGSCNVFMHMNRQNADAAMMYVQSFIFNSLKLGT